VALGLVVAVGQQSRRLMITDESSDSTGAGRSVHVDFLFPETPYRPPIIVGHLVKSSPTFLHIGPRMPIVPVSLDDEPRVLEHEIGLKASEHGLVHLKLQAALLELGTQKALDRGHFSREGLPQPILAVLLSALRTQVGLAHFLPRLRRAPHGKGQPKSLIRIGPALQGHLSNLVPCLHRELLSESRLANLLTSGVSMMFARMSNPRPLDSFWRMMASFSHTVIVLHTGLKRNRRATC